METYWIWSVIGLGFISLELIVGELTFLWFGLSGLFTGLMVYLFPNLSNSAQFLFFAFEATVSLLIYKKLVASKEKNSSEGQSYADIGSIGIIDIPPSSTQQGEIVFKSGLMGSKRWPCVSDEEIIAGRNAKVVAINGQVLTVKETI